MAEENRSGGRSDGRNRRRRYYKRKSGGQGNGAGQENQTAPSSATAIEGGAQAAAQQGVQKHGGQQQSRQQKGGVQSAAQGATPGTSEGRARGVRKRRRSRSRRGDFRPEMPVVVEKDQEYIAPKSVFVYTHVARPSSREAYEFRSEHFSRVGHTLDDYTVDLSLIFDTPRPDFGAGVAQAYADMEAAGDIATEARFQPWVEHIEGESRPTPEMLPTPAPTPIQHESPLSDDEGAPDVGLSEPSESA